MEIHIQKKQYGSKIVLHDIVWTLSPGVHGLLGPNGAGKTTLMRCILGLLPYEGSIQGVDRPERIGYLPQHFRMFNEYTVEDALRYFAVLKGADTSTIDPLLRTVHLEEERKKRVKQLSGGMLRRLGLAQALMGEGEVLILDEPTVGLDPKERVYLRNLIAELGKGRTILLSTHIVEDIEHIADRFAVLAEGTIRYTGELAEAVRTVTGKIGMLRIPAIELSQWEKHVQVLQMRTEGKELVCRIHSDVLPEVATVVQPTLEDVYMHLLTPHA